MLLLIPLLVIAAIFEFAGDDRYVARSANMAPTIAEDDSFQAEPFRAGREPAAGDIVVFRWRPGTPEESIYVERIVGLPGDRIQMIAGVLTINDVPVEMERVGEAPGNFGRTVVRLRETLPNGVSYEVYDMGRTSSDDTDVFVVPEGHYFVLGDNRDNSLDSRVRLDRGGVGFVSRAAMIGWVEVAAPAAELAAPVTTEASPSPCSAAVTAAATLNALAIFDGAAACGEEERTADVLFLMLLGQSRANADMLVLRSVEDFDPRTAELFLHPTYQAGARGFNAVLGIVLLYAGVGDLPFVAFFRDEAAVAMLLQRVRDVPAALPPGYDPGWPYRQPVDAVAYDRAFTSDRVNRAVGIQSLAYLMRDDGYHDAQLAAAEFVRERLGGVIDGGDLLEILAPADDALMAAYADPAFPQLMRQAASGFNGPAGPSTLVLLSEADVRQSWLAHALPDGELAALIAGTDFSREALVVLALGRRANASGHIILSDVSFATGGGIPGNDGYGISAMLGVVPADCGIAFADSYPFVVGRIAAMPGTTRTSSTGETNFDGGCVPIVAAESVAPDVGDEGPLLPVLTPEEIARLEAALQEAAANRPDPGPFPRPTGEPLPPLTPEQLAEIAADRYRPPDGQIATGFNGIPEAGTLVIASAEDLRSSWLASALTPEQMVAALATDFADNVLVVLALGGQTAASGNIVLYEIFYDPGFPAGTNAGYWISARLGTIDPICGQPQRDSFPFVVAVAERVEGALVINGSFATHSDPCGPIMGGSPR